MSDRKAGNTRPSQEADVTDPGGVIAKGCPGASEYGHGLSLTRVHAGGCCDRWEKTHA